MSAPINSNVVSVPQFLHSALDELDLKKLDLTVTYHDPCHLGRRHKIYSHLQKVVEAICDIVKMKANENHCKYFVGAEASDQDTTNTVDDGQNGRQDVPKA